MILFKDEVRKAGHWSLEFRKDWYSVSHSLDLDLESVSSVKSQKKKLRSFRMQMLSYREEIANAGLDKNINQYFAALTNMRSVGVMGD